MTRGVEKKAKNSTCGVRDDVRGGGNGHFFNLGCMGSMRTVAERGGLSLGSLKGGGRGGGFGVNKIFFNFTGDRK